MTTIQDRIIKDFDISYGKVVIGGVKISETAYYISLKQFLIQSIKEVEEETRKEINNYASERDTLDWKCLTTKDYDKGRTKLDQKYGISITNKEKQNG